MQRSATSTPQVSVAEHSSLFCSLQMRTSMLPAVGLRSAGSQSSRCCTRLRAASRRALRLVW
ncbi:hypothetical protein [Delftia sp. 60]|uniref:hypothetical protein n=1 Tax=Delftia sp. 60 TaxID=2035216 RepID=UPI002094B492|nr:MULTISPECIES: hypothetical protein [Delftia]